MNIRSAIKAHEDWVLTAIAFAITGAVIAILVWGVTFTSGYLGSSIDANNAAATKIQFDLDGASKLNLRGLK